MLRHAFIELGTYGADRAEGTAGILKDHAQLRPVKLPQIRGRKIGQVFSFVPDIAPGDKAGFAQQAHGRLDECGFTGATLPHDAEDLPFVHRKAHILDDFDTVIGNINVFIT